MLKCRHELWSHFRSNVKCVTHGLSDKLSRSRRNVSHVVKDVSMTSLLPEWTAYRQIVVVDTPGAVLGSGKMQQVPYGSVDRDKPLVRVPFTRLAVITVCLPLLGLITCIVLSLLYHYNDATYTHCQVSKHTHTFRTKLPRRQEK